MSFLTKSRLIREYNNSQSYLLNDDGERRWAAKRINESAESFDFLKQYDIFLSHSFNDARLVKQIYDMLQEKGFTVYVDWIEDDALSRDSVTSHTAMVIRHRMDNCNSLIYLTSDSAEKSVWMPWELGYMDGNTGRVAVAPILDDEDEQFDGREYLGIYPYLDLTGDNFYIHENIKTWTTFDKWMSGKNPVKHS